MNDDVEWAGEAAKWRRIALAAREVAKDETPRVWAEDFEVYRDGKAIQIALLETFNPTRP